MLLRSQTTQDSFEFLRLPHRMDQYSIIDVSFLKGLDTGPPTPRTIGPGEVVY